jgi:hypothetical protein
MPILHRDFETFSTLDLTRCGGWRYATDPTTGIWCASYAIDDQPTRIWLPGNPVPDAFFEAARNPDWFVAAHNDAFETVMERFVLAPRYGWPLVPIERHICTMAMALAAALPGALEKIGDALSLPLRKDAEGHRLMLKMAKPRKPRKGEDPNGIYWHDEPENIARLSNYCIRDTEVERLVYHHLPQLTDAEHALWVLDAVINARGFYTDGPLLEAASRIAAAAARAVQDELADITRLDQHQPDRGAAGLALWSRLRSEEYPEGDALPRATAQRARSHRPPRNGAAQGSRARGRCEDRCHVGLSRRGRRTRSRHAAISWSQHRTMERNGGAAAKFQARHR